MITRGEEQKLANTSEKLEPLLKLRTALESRLAAIEEEKKSLEEETKIIRQRVAIKELNESLKKKQHELTALHLQRKRLEYELNCQ
jgi:chromosome segregation ATPase